MAATPDLLVERDGAVLTVTFHRPDKHNAMTSAMYDRLAEACAEADRDPEVRAMVLAGAGDRAFVAGTDIAEFLAFEGGEDGVRYERRITEVLDALEQVRVPTIAAVSGHCFGGGLALATACDLRVVTPDSRFGYPIARTLGNCLSASTLAALVECLGAARTKTLLLLARPMDAEEAVASGFAAEVVPGDRLRQRVAALAEEMSGHAPLTMWATKEALRRLRVAAMPDDTDIIHTVYGSRDFHEGVRDFLAKRPHTWTGR
ncbi:MULTISPECIES: enoyl-CoA hydratase/isomerase family protein [unclassified Nocardioides]|uniref:enoyl-CoA hydratase/isomerase family protein n=1 Tax=unclassified Nocardioides TaxID=2615069 RepID=UPI00361AB15E